MVSRQGRGRLWREYHRSSFPVTARESSIVWSLSQLDGKVQGFLGHLSVKKKEEELVPLKKDIEEKLGELNDLQARLTTYAKTLADREEALKNSKMAHLVELYTAMEPTKAAAIMEKLKMETAVLILRHMKGKAAGQIIALMKPETGAQVVEKPSRMDEQVAPDPELYPLPTHSLSHTKTIIRPAKGGRIPLAPASH